jgi:hypothetical protein
MLLRGTTIYLMMGIYSTWIQFVLTLYAICNLTITDTSRYKGRHYETKGVEKEREKYECSHLLSMMLQTSVKKTFLLSIYSLRVRMS